MEFPVKISQGKITQKYLQNKKPKGRGPRASKRLLGMFKW